MNVWTPVQKISIGWVVLSCVRSRHRGGGGKSVRKVKFGTKWRRICEGQDGFLRVSFSGVQLSPKFRTLHVPVYQPSGSWGRQPADLPREDAVSGLSTWLESLTNWGHLGMETSLLYIQKQGYFWFIRAGSSLISWNRLLASEPGAWAVLEPQQGA